MVFAISFGLPERNNAKGARALIRSRRHLDLNEYINSCKDDCVMSHLYAVNEGVYTLQQLRVN